MCLNLIQLSSYRRRILHLNTIFYPHHLLKMRIYLYILTFVISISAFPQIVWTNTGGDGLWSKPNNWSTGQLPTASDNVLVIWNQGGGYVKVDGNFSCNNLIMTARPASGAGVGLSAVIDVLTSSKLTVNGTTTLNVGSSGTRIVNINLFGSAIVEFKGAVSATTPIARVNFDLDPNGTFDPTTVIVRSTFPTGITFSMGHSTFDYASATNQSIPVYDYHNLTVSNGATKTVSSPLTIFGNLNIANSTNFNCNTLNLDSNFVNNGTFTPGTGTVTITGDASTISGSSKTTFYNLTVDKTESLSLTGDSVKISNQLQIDAGSITTNNKLVLLASSANNYGYLIDASSSGPNGSVIGNMLIQKTINARGGSSTRGNAGFYSSPLSNGSVGSFNTSTSNFFFLNNSVWTKASSTAQLISPGVGFSRRNAKTGERLFLYGAPNNGSVSVPLYVGEGDTAVNTVGNPYPSSIDWGAVDKTNIGGEGAAYLWNSSGGFNTFIDGTISVGQGFQVIAIGPSLDFDNSCRITSKTSFVRLAKESKPKLNILLKSDSLEDESFVVLNENASEDFDVRIDAKKLFATAPSIPSLALLKGSTPTVIYHLKYDHELKIIPIFTKVAANGIYTFNFSNREGFGSSYEIYLGDLKKGESNLIINDVSDFEIDLTTSDTNRFELIFKTTNITTSNEEIIDDKIFAYGKNKEIIIKNLGNENINEINIYDISGILVKAANNIKTKETKFNFVTNPSGFYVVRVNTTGKSYSSKVILE